MSFPEDPLGFVCELYAGGDWQDVTTDVLQTPGIDITRGNGNESSGLQQATMSLTLRNTSGDYTPRNPTGAYFGSLGRNTPIRLALRSAQDDFDRTVASGWGSTAAGDVWTPISIGNSVTPGSGVHSVSGRATFRGTYLGGVVHRDVDVKVTFTTAITNVTGGDIEPANIILRGQAGAASYYIVRVVITSAEVVTVTWHHSTGGELATPVTVTGLTFGAGVALTVRAQAEGDTLRAKVWNAAGAEPAGWHCTVVDDTITTAGWTGVRSGVSGANTNALPVVFNYGDYAVTVPRFAGEVASWPVKRDVSGRARTVPIQAAGILRRLTQGRTLQSTMRRGVLSVDPVVYWPCEESSGATVLASGLPGGQALLANPRPPRFAADDSFASSAPLPTFSGSWWHGQLPNYDRTSGQLQVRLLLSVPTTGATDGEKIIRLSCTGGTTGFWDVLYETPGDLRLVIFNPAGSTLYDSGPVTFELDGRPVRLSLELTQDGADIDWSLGTIGIDGDAGVLTGTLAGRTFVRADWLNIGGDGLFTDVAAGHVTIQNAVTSIFELENELTGYVGETAGDRLVRLCAENGVPLALRGDVADTMPMGAQRVAKLTTLLEECVGADRGALVDARGSIGLAYRTRTDAYHQASAVVLDFSAKELGTPWEPVDDDANLLNDVTVKRVDGGEARATLDTGRMSTLDPTEGGAGRVDRPFTVNVDDDVRLPDLAGWLLSQGTVDAPRFPRLHLDLANARLAADPDRSRALLDLDVLDLVTVTGAASADIHDDLHQVVRGYTESLPSNRQHHLVLNCVPAAPYGVGVFDSDTSKYDSLTTTLNEHLDTTETGVTVAIASGPLWTTSAGQMPIPIMVGGEEMSVTAVSGATSPQTFTVTRSVNGIVKEHAVGTQVRLARPVKFGL